MRRYPTSSVVLCVSLLGLGAACDGAAFDDGGADSAAGSGLSTLASPASHAAALGGAGAGEFWVLGLASCATLEVSATTATSGMATFLLQEDPANDLASAFSDCPTAALTRDPGSYHFTTIGAGSLVTRYIGDAEAGMASGAAAYLRLKTTGNAWRVGDATSRYDGLYVVSDASGPICQGTVTGLSGAGGVIESAKTMTYLALPLTTDLHTLSVDFDGHASTACTDTDIGDQAYANLTMSAPKVYFP